MTDAGSLLRAARHRRGLTQAELASRAGVTQSVVSTYESGNRQPSLPMLMRLVEAAGLELHVEARVVEQDLERLTGPLGHKVRSCRAALRELAAARGVSNLRVFGSVARGEDSTSSDVDLLVDVGPDVGLFALGSLQHELELLIGARVDLVPSDGVREHVLESMRSDLVPL